MGPTGSSGSRTARKLKTLTSTQSRRLIRDGEKEGGGGILRWGKGVATLSPPQKGKRKKEDSCIKIGSDESQLNVSLIVMDKVKRHAVFTDHRGKRETLQCHHQNESCIEMGSDEGQF